MQKFKSVTAGKMECACQSVAVISDYEAWFAPLLLSEFPE